MQDSYANVKGRTITVCIEGPDAVGKTTQLHLLQKKLIDTGYRVLLQEVPVKGVFKRVIYWMLNNGYAKKFPTTFQLVHFFNRFIWQYFYLPFIKSKYDFIILGRWSLSSLIYGTLEGVSPTLLKILESMLFIPYVTFIIDGDKFLREQNDTYEADIELQKNVQRLYSLVDESNVFKIDNRNKDPEKISQEIFLKLGHAIICWDKS